MNRDKLDDYLHRFVRGKVTNEEVYNDGGHGCAILSDAPPPESFDFIAITGPSATRPRI